MMEAGKKGTESATRKHSSYSLQNSFCISSYQVTQMQTELELSPSPHKVYPDILSTTKATLLPPPT